MDVYLLRHGIAVAAAELPPGTDRPLTEKGAKRVRKAARGLRRLGMRFEAILTSPLGRAQQTASIVAETLAQEGQLATIEALKPDHSADELVSGLKDYMKCTTLLLVGHEPLLSETVSYLLTGKKNAIVKVALKKGGLVGVELDSLPPRNPGTIHTLLTPKILRRLAASG
jgi:phosphohistidine phosphatase